jgi:hypothetical protein
VKDVLDDLTTLPAKRRQDRLETLADQALPCWAVTVFDGNPDDGITVALHVDARRRGDVLDLARVIDDDARVHGFCDWSLLPPAGRRNDALLLLRVSFERPVHCDYVVSFDLRDHASDALRAALPLLLAASRLAFVLDDPIESGWPLVCIDAPAAREPILELLKAVGV